jgi:hypothetical protein
MFTISRLFSKNNNIDVQDQYIKVASLIEEGSVLDRRKLSNDRRNTIERRVRLRNAFYGLDKRCDNNRRSLSRRMEKSLENNIKENTDNGRETQNLNDVEILVRDQLEIIKKVSELSEVAKLNEFQGIEEKIRDIRFKVKSITSEEEKLLYLSFDKNVKHSNDKTDKSLTEILFYIHDVSDQVLEYLDRYYYPGVTKESVGFFLLDMNIVYEALNQILNKKKEHLYPMYK